MSHKYKTQSGAFFIHNPDMSGDVDIVIQGGPFEHRMTLPGSDLVEFMRERHGGELDQAREWAEVAEGYTPRTSESENGTLHSGPEKYACPDCPIGGREGDGPICPKAAECDRQAEEFSAAMEAERESIAYHSPPRAPGRAPTLQDMHTLMARIGAEKEELIHAWIAATGLSPIESVLVQQTMGDGTIRTWVEKREPGPTPHTPHDGYPEDYHR